MRILSPVRSFLTVALLSLAAFPASGLRVMLDDNYPPYSFRDAQGIHEGILVDEWRLWSDKTGVAVELVPLAWKDALRVMSDGGADVLDTVFLTPSRSLVWSFTPPYAPISTALYHRVGLTSFDSLKDLKGFEVGIKQGDASAEVLANSGVQGVREFPSYEAVIDAAVRGDIHVFLMDVPPARHFLISRGLADQFRQGFVLSQDSFRRAVAQSRPEVLALVNRGFGAISAAEHEEITQRWLGAAVPDPGTKQIFALAVVLVLVVLGLLLALVFFLRWQVRRQTGRLQGTEARLRTSEARAEAILNALPDLILVLGPGGVIREARGPAGSAWAEEAGAMGGRPIRELFPLPNEEETAASLREKLRKEGFASLELEVTFRGVPRIVDARVIRMTDDEDLVVVRDISDTRRAWEADLHRNKLESLGVLAGGIAHDFNNSLAVIQGFVSLARVQLGSPEKALKSLDKAVLATRRAAGLTSQLRVLAQGSEVQRRPLDLRQLAEESAQLALVGSPCLLGVEALGGPWVVEADADQLSQVFHNLTLNAVQAMPRGGKVTLVFQRSAAGALSVSVVDEGTGIRPEDLRRIFDPYFTTKPQGSGLGLSVVHAVVQRHGGTVKVDSRPGRGTVFTVTLPGSEAPVPTPGAPAMPDNQAVAGLRVLIMEDEPDLRDLMTQVALSLNLDPVAVSHGSAGVAAFDEAAAAGRPFPLVISDLLVPGEMGGREMVSVLRSRPGRFKALAVTGFSTERSAEDFHEQGFDVIVGKPFTVDEIKTRIIELMKSPWKTAPNT